MIEHRPVAALRNLIAPSMIIRLNISGIRHQAASVHAVRLPRNAWRLSMTTVSALQCAAFACAMSFSPRAHATDCFDAAAAYQNVNPMVLRAIAWQESHNRADAKHVNANGSVDYGVMQINTIHLPTLAQYGIDRETLMSPCKNIYIAAWQLRRQILKYGNTWAAVGAYHSATPALRDQYARQIAGILRRWGVLQERRQYEVDAIAAR